MVFQQRTTFRLKQVDDHLWIVLTDPHSCPDQVVIVSFTTEAKYAEKTCVVDRNEHPQGLTRRSCIAFEFAKVVSVEQLIKLKDSGHLEIQPDFVSSDLLNRILASVPNSTGIKDAVVDVLIAQKWIDLFE